MNIDATNLAGWFQLRPVWLQTALDRVVSGKPMDIAAITELYDICKREAVLQTGKPVAPLTPPSAFAAVAPGQDIRLRSISDVKGIEALAPRKGLTFGDEPVTIVYGLNGSGKSGYIRILNNVCGSKNRRKLLGNVFQAPVGQSCIIGYELDGVAKQLLWTPVQGLHPELAGLEIYDSEGGEVYITAENEVAFEPWLLGLLQQLVGISEAVNDALAAEIAALPSVKPAFPAELTATAAADWYGKVCADTKSEQVVFGCDWSKARQDELDALNARLLEKSPADQAKFLRARKVAFEQFATDLRSWNAKLGISAVADLMDAKADATVKRKAVDEDAAKVFGGAPLKGVGQESWQLLWQQARVYSEAIAYPANQFPVVDEHARCLLCQQLLTPEAGARLVSFESFVKGELEKLAIAAESRLAALIGTLPQIPPENILNERLATLGLNDEAAGGNAYRQARNALQVRLEALAWAKSEDQLPSAPTGELAAGLSASATELESKAREFDADAQSGDNTALKKAARELEALQWVSGQKAAIESEIERLRNVAALDAARRLTNTTALSSKKSELSQILVSEAFIKRFQVELKALSAARLDVELVQTRAAKGHVLHQIKLKNSKIQAPISHVLSEGECRVVSLAAFLADVGGIEANTPFVFDDPISSLDQDYEESVVARLASLAKTRQVIVFTHRLSLSAYLQDAVKAVGLVSRVVAVSREAWGSGEPVESPFSAQKPEQAINSRLDAVAKARKVLRDVGRTEYEIYAKAICGDTRIVLERLVEDVLLKQVVRRFRRTVQTGQIKELAKIRPEDCKFIEELMTKYSRFEHSQPSEAPVALPEPDEILSDLTTLQEWLKEFTNRPVPQPS